MLPSLWALVEQLRPFCGFVGIIYGKQVKDRDGQTASEVLDPQGAALHALRSSSGCLPQVWALPDLFPEAR